MPRTYAEIRARREAQERAAAAEKRRRDATRQARDRVRDLASPIGFGPVWEAMSPQRHVTPDPGDPSTPPGWPGAKGPGEP